MSVAAAGNTAALREEIRSALAGVGLGGKSNGVSPEILGQCAALASTLNVSPQRMAESWEAFSLNRNIDKLDPNSFAAYRLAVIKESDSSGAGGSAELLREMESGAGAVVSRPSLGGGGKRDATAADADGLPAVTPPAKRFNSALMGTAGVDSLAAAASSSNSGSKRVSLSPYPPTALLNKQQAAASGNSSGARYSDRTSSGKVAFTYEPSQLEGVTTAAPSDVAMASSSPKPRCTVSYDFPSNVQKPYRHMFTTLEERAKALDDRLVELGSDIRERYGLGEQEEQGSGGVGDDTESAGVAALESVGVPRQEKVCCIGRICNSAHEGSINATSVLLEGSRHPANGQRVELDLSHMIATKTPYSLFPGQIVAVEGMNASGRKMVAHRICEGAAHEPLKSRVGDLLKFHHGDSFQDGSPLKIMTACGPYTTNDNLEFEPLVDLLSNIQDEKPDVVILCGPFVSMDHQAVRSGQTTLQFQDGEEILVPFDTFFANKVAGLLEDYFASDESLSTQFVLQPSLEDATAEWVYPQAPFTDSSSGGRNLSIPGAEGIEAGTLGLHHVETAGREDGKRGPRRVHLVPNPCTLKINEVVVGLTSTDVIRHISADETNKHLEPGSRLGRIAQHMLQQQSFYPLFPPARTANLDWKQRHRWEMPCQPDLLIVPSMLTRFARPVLDSTVVVNPGRLSWGTMGGTYAVVEVHPLKRETLENAGGEDVEVLHALHDRTRVEVKHI